MPAEELPAAAEAAATALAKIDLAAHAATKARARGPAIACVQAVTAEQITLESPQERVAHRGTN